MRTSAHILLNIRSFYALWAKRTENKKKYIYLKLLTFEVLSGVKGFLTRGTGVLLPLYLFQATGVGAISVKRLNASGLDVCICKKNKVHV